MPMRRIVVFCLSLILAIGLEAQGVYTCYDFNVPRVNAPAPKGYTAFYISHYGRHGARYIYSENEYTVLKEVFSKASLTPFGEQIRTKFDSLYPLLKGKAGKLSPLGKEQQRVLAVRMLEDWTKVFSRCCSVDAVSSDVPRCVHSMDSFLNSLRENRKLRKVAGQVDVSLLPVLKNGPIVRKNIDSLFLARFDVDALYSRFFKDVTSAKSLAEPSFFIQSLYYFSVHLPSAGMAEEPVIAQSFSKKELEILSRLDDEKFNFHGGWSKPINVARIWPLLENFVEEADIAVSSGKRQVRLRFGHDNTLIPFMTLLRMEPFSEHIFRSSDCPMGANVRWIFAKNRKGDVQIKVQYNESDVSSWMPWEEFKNDCLDKIAWAKQELKI